MIFIKFLLQCEKLSWLFATFALVFLLFELYFKLKVVREHLVLLGYVQLAGTFPPLLFKPLVLIFDVLGSQDVIDALDILHGGLIGLIRAYLIDMIDHARVWLERVNALVHSTTSWLVGGPLQDSSIVALVSFIH